MSHIYVFCDNTRNKTFIIESNDRNYAETILYETYGSKYNSSTFSSWRVEDWKAADKVTSIWPITKHPQPQQEFVIGDLVRINVLGNCLIKDYKYDPKKSYIVVRFIGICPVKKNRYLIIILPEHLPPNSLLPQQYSKLTSTYYEQEGVSSDYIGYSFTHVEKISISKNITKESRDDSVQAIHGEDKSSLKEKVANKYKIGDKVLCRVRPKKRIVFDDPYKEGRLLENRPFDIIGEGSNESFIVLVEDTNLARWVIEDHHIKDYKIDAKFKSQYAYSVFSVAIGGIAPHLSHCKNCQKYNEDLKNKLKTEEAQKLLLNASE